MPLRREKKSSSSSSSLFFELLQYCELSETVQREELTGWLTAVMKITITRSKSGERKRQNSSPPMGPLFPSDFVECMFVFYWLSYDSNRRCWFINCKCPQSISAEIHIIISSYLSGRVGDIFKVSRDICVEHEEEGEGGKRQEISKSRDWS